MALYLKLRLEEGKCGALKKDHPPRKPRIHERGMWIWDLTLLLFDRLRESPFGLLAACRANSSSLAARRNKSLSSLWCCSSCSGCLGLRVEFSKPSSALSVLSGSIEMRREVISTLLRVEGLKPRMGLMRGRPGAVSVTGRDVCGGAATGGACSSSLVVMDCCCATQSVVDAEVEGEFEFEFSSLYDRWVIIALGGPFPNSSKPFLLFLPGTFLAFCALGVKTLELGAG
jgi:hypothetical protein